jgi:hemerythrin-like domain-containing protein
MVRQLLSLRTMKATDLLKQQHRSVEALFAKIEDGDSDALEDLASALAAHMSIEHEFFYPAASEVDGDLVLESFEEHSVAEFALKRALACDSDDEAFDARVTVLKELIAHHVKEEEDELFPEVEKKFTKDQLEQLGQQMATRFEEVLKAGYAATLPSNYEQTAADLAQGLDSAGT